MVASTKRRHPALAALGADGGDGVVGRVEQRLQLGAGQRPPGRAALVVGAVHGHSGGLADLGGVSAEAIQALTVPAVGGVDHVGEKRAQRLLVGAQRRVRPPARHPLVRRPPFELARQPPPRPVLDVGSKPADDPGVGVDGSEGQVAAQLLGAPPVQHRLEDVRFGIEQADALNQVQLGRSADLDLAVHGLPEVANGRPSQSSDATRSADAQVRQLRVSAIDPLGMRRRSANPLVTPRRVPVPQLRIQSNMRQCQQNAGSRPLGLTRFRRRVTPRARLRTGAGQFRHPA